MAFFLESALKTHWAVLQGSRWFGLRNVSSLVGPAKALLPFFEVLPPWMSLCGGMPPAPEAIFAVENSGFSPMGLFFSSFFF